MSMTKRLAVVLLTLGTMLAPQAVPAQADTASTAGTAVCEPPGPPSEAAVQGYGAWDPPVELNAEEHYFENWLWADCSQGSGDPVGQYFWYLAGYSNEGCGGGTGVGFIEGEGPKGDLYGNFEFYKVGVHYYMTVNFTMAQQDYHMSLWVDVIPEVGPEEQGYCFYEYPDMFGHAAIKSVPRQGQDLSGQEVHISRHGLVL
jgi:hypothetical protein